MWPAENHLWCHPSAAKEILSVHSISGPKRPIWGPMRPISGPVHPIWGPVRPMLGPVSTIWGPVHSVSGLVRPMVGPVCPIWSPVHPIWGPVCPIWGSSAYYKVLLSYYPLIGLHYSFFWSRQGGSPRMTGWSGCVSLEWSC